MEKMFRAECPEDCFSVQGTSQKEIADMMKVHAKSKHHMKVSDAEAKRMVMPC